MCFIFILCLLSLYSKELTLSVYLHFMSHNLMIQEFFLVVLSCYNFIALKKNTILIPLCICLKFLYSFLFLELYFFFWVRFSLFPAFLFYSLDLFCFVLRFLIAVASVAEHGF